jgi:hypothetical protein
MIGEQVNPYLHGTLEYKAWERLATLQVAPNCSSADIQMIIEETINSVKDSYLLETPPTPTYGTKKDPWWLNPRSGMRS